MTQERPPLPPATGWRDAVPCGLLQTKTNGTILSANSTFCSWVALSPQDLLGRRLQDLFTVGGRMFHQTHWGPLMEMHGSITELKLDILRPDGASLPLVFSAVRQSYDGQVIHEVAAFAARERDRYERELLRSRKQLEGLVEEAKQHQAAADDRAQFAEQMVGIVSHDLRNPLSSVGMNVALLERDPLTVRQSRALFRTQRSLVRANELIADLLDFTRARMGNGIPIRFEPTNLHEAVAHAVEELTVTHPTRDFKHVRHGDGVCVADANRLTQLTGNLVANAVTYGRENAPVLVTSTVDTATCTIAVHNEGQVIPESSQARIFEPMTRGPGAAAKGAPRSVGLGLFIVREIALAHHGKASVVSTEDMGTTFLVEFPQSPAR